MEKVKRFFRSYTKRIVVFILSCGIMCISVLSSPINAHASNSSLTYFDFGSYEDAFITSNGVTSTSGNTGINNGTYTYLQKDFVIDLNPSGLISSTSSDEVYTSFDFSVTPSATLNNISCGPGYVTSDVVYGYLIDDMYVVCTTTKGTFYLRGTSINNTYTVEGRPVSMTLFGKLTVWARWNYPTGNGDLKYKPLKLSYLVSSTSSVSNIRTQAITNGTVSLPSNVTNSLVGGSGSSLTGSSDASSTNTSFGENVTSVNSTSDGYFDSFSTNMDSLDVVSNLSSIGVGFASVKLWLEAFYNKLPTPLQSVIFVSLYVGIIALLLSVIGRIKSHGGS